MNASLPLSTCPATNLQNYVDPPLNNPSSNVANAGSMISHLAEYRMAYNTASAACGFLTEKEITIANSNNCFKSIPNLLKKAEMMRADANEIRQREIIFDNFQPYFHAQQLASQKFSTACVFSSNDEATLETPNRCLESLTTYIDQTEITNAAETEIIQADRTFGAMHGLEMVIRGFQGIYRILLNIRDVK